LGIAEEDETTTNRGGARESPTNGSGNGTDLEHVDVLWFPPWRGNDGGPTAIGGGWRGIGNRRQRSHTGDAVVGNTSCNHSEAVRGCIRGDETIEPRHVHGGEKKRSEANHDRQLAMDRRPNGEEAPPGGLDETVDGVEDREGWPAAKDTP